MVLYSAFADEHLAVLATIAGADALVNKSADPDELPAAALAAASGSAEPPSPSPAALEAAGSRLDPERPADPRHAAAQDLARGDRAHARHAMSRG